MEIRMKHLKIQIGDTTRAGAAALAHGTLWVHVNGETFAVETGRASRRGASVGGGAQQAGTIAAPMPGKIIKILVAQDSSVEMGQVLLVMEAMKMEYTLKAQAPGTG